MMLSSMELAVVSRRLLALMWLRTLPSSGRTTIDSTGKLGTEDKREREREQATVMSDRSRKIGVLWANVAL